MPLFQGTTVFSTLVRRAFRQRGLVPVDPSHPQDDQAAVPIQGMDVRKGWQNVVEIETVDGKNFGFLGMGVGSGSCSLLAYRQIHR